MNQPMKKAIVKNLKVLCRGSLLPIVMMTLMLRPYSVGAESLFKGGIQYQAQVSVPPRSLFAMPRSASIGDLVTIQINETFSSQAQNNTAVKKAQDITENSTSILSRIIQKVTGIRNVLPSVDGSSSENSTTINATTQRTFTLNEQVTCLVVNVLPNGNLLVEGRKRLSTSDENQTLRISGIVNPYYLTAQNQIPSTMVANLSVDTIGDGILSHQKGEGIIHRLFRVIN